MTLQQILIQIHPGAWYLLPFNPQANAIPGVWKRTFLCFTLTVIRACH